MAEILTTIAIILGVSLLFSELFFRIKYPREIGQILAGMILGLPVLSFLFDPSVILDIRFLSDLGIIFLLLLTGLQINLEKFKRAEKDAIIIAISGILLPFALGFILMKVEGYSNLIGVIVGICFSLSAEGTTLKVLLDMRALNSKVGAIMLGAGIFDDLLEVLSLSMLLVIIGGNAADLALFPLKVGTFVLLVYIFYKLFPKGLAAVEREHSRVSTFSFILIFGIAIAVLAKDLGLGPIIGAFIAGIIIHLSEHRKWEYMETVKELQVVTFSLIIPFF